MNQSRGQPRDRWADWLLRGRQRGMGREQARKLAGQLRRVRDRVLRGARLRSGLEVLDVGAGTGLLAAEARRRVGPTGRVVALDISQDALRECGQQNDLKEAASLHAVVGDALQLPFHDCQFDAVLTRSVLIYLTKRRLATRELYRVLRPGGWASVYEPINRAYRAWIESPDLDLSPVQPAHDRIVAYLRQQWEHEKAMLGFDERDLVEHFLEAGFESVRLAYDQRHERTHRRRADILASLNVQPNPTMPSYEEGAKAVLGAAADAHLVLLSKLMLAQPLTGVSADAYVTAER